MLITPSEEFANDLKKYFNLKYVKPSLETETERLLSRTADLYSKRIQRYKNYRDYNNISLSKKSLNQIDVLLKDRINSLQMMYITQVLSILQEESPESFEHFTLSLWDQLTISLFDIVLPRKIALVVFHDKTGEPTKRLLPDGYYSEQIVQTLLCDYQQEVEQIRFDYHDFMNASNEYLVALRSNEAKTISDMSTL